MSTQREDWITGGRRDPVGSVSEIRARAVRGERLSGDEFGRLWAEGDEELLYLNALLRQQQRAGAPIR